MNQNPEQIARDQIDKQLRAAGWVVQGKSDVDLYANTGVAVREYRTNEGPADYVLFINQKAVGVIEAKREEAAVNITKVEDQSLRYATAGMKYVSTDALNFAYESTGVITRFTDYRDPKPRSREVFGFHRPATLLAFQRNTASLRARLQNMPLLDETGLRPAQIDASRSWKKASLTTNPVP